LFLKEIILENFMSYEYARLPLEPGLNIICGPNGSGKSSILLAMSVALGQTYTERSRRLSDLIRWGEKVARVTLVFDNTSDRGRRPFPDYKTDDFQLSRYLRKDGTYWYEANFRAIDKTDVIHLLSKHSINPDNMLLIMHQNMVEEFALTSSQKKLEMIEEAVGLSEYRNRIIDSRTKLSRILSEEESVKNLFEGAKNTLDYWTNEYNKYKRAKELEKRRKRLDRELFWSRFLKQERIKERWQRKVQEKKIKLKQIEEELSKTKEEVKNLSNSLNDLNYKRKKRYFSLLQLEKDRKAAEVKAQVLTNVIQRISNPVENLLESENYFGKMRKDIELSDEIKNSLNEEVNNAEKELLNLEERIGSTTEEYINKRVREEVLSFRQTIMKEEIEDCSTELSRAQIEYDNVRALADEYEPRIETSKEPKEIAEERKVAIALLNSLGKISEDAEKMFQSYSETYGELKNKIEILSENRERTMQEVETRVELWRGLITNLLEKINPIYQKILSKIDADGKVRLIQSEDVETAGLELHVGFKGGKPAILNAYTQSGGERSTATISFLLALQQHIKSPIRAVDEFDVHMDPRNRELLTEIILSLMTGKEYQYLTITPGQLIGKLENAHIITVQKTSEASKATVAD